MKRYFMTIREAAEYIGVAEKTLRNRVCPSAKDPYPVQPKRIGRSVRFDKAELDKYIDSL